MLAKIANIIALKRIRPSKYLVISTLIHLFVVLMFLCPHIFFKSERKFISNNMMSVQVLVQQKVQKAKEHKKEQAKKEDKLGLLPKDKLISTKNNKPTEATQESIVANQYVSNIKYNILKSSEPQYPVTVKRLNLLQEIVIKTRLLIDKEGNIEKIEFLESNIDKSLEQFFHKEIRSSLNTWQFSTVTVDNTPVKIYFYKNFVFQNS